MRSSKLIIAAMRARSLLLRMLRGVRCRTEMKSSRDLGVYLALAGCGSGLLGDLVRYLSSLGSSQRVIFRSKLSNMI